MEVVATASPHILIEHLQGRLSKGGLSLAKLDARKLQKSAIRACTDQLVSVGGFKFRRSAFRGLEPKVTLMAPQSLGVSGKAIPIDFSVNTVCPLYNATLLTECGCIDPRAKALILLVKRWAKDRGVCHAAKGHLAPYAWTVLAVYFMQVGIDSCPLLPQIEGFKQISGLSNSNAGVQRVKFSENWKPPQPSSVGAQMTVAKLLKAFFHFYAHRVNWRKEAASARLGRRAPAGPDLPLHIVPCQGNRTQVGPSIEDPFDPRRNLGTTITDLGLERLHEELQRAYALFEEHATLSEILEPWTPPEQLQANSDVEGNGDEGSLNAPDVMPRLRVMKQPSPAQGGPSHTAKRAAQAREEASTKLRGNAVNQGGLQ